MNAPTALNPEHPNPETENLQTGPWNGKNVMEKEVRNVSVESKTQPRNKLGGGLTEETTEKLSTLY